MNDPESLDLFQTTYSPRKIGFLIQHFEELEELACSPRSSAHIAEKQSREWLLLQDYPGRLCICPDLGGPPTPSTAGRGAYRHISHRGSDIIGDLETAAQSLPVRWAVTRRIHESMGRTMLARWEFRYSVAQHPPLDPQPTLFQALLWMSKSLGWVSPVRGAAPRLERVG